MSWFPKLVALDVDGTIVDGENLMTTAVGSAIHAIREQGAEVVISTGRAAPGVYDVLGKLSIDEGIAVSSNGAVVFDVEPFEVRHCVTFDAREAVDRILTKIPDAIVAVEDVGIGYRASRPFPMGEINGSVTVDVVENLIREPVSRVVIRSMGHEPEEFHALVADLGLDDTNYFIGYSSWLDLAPVGVSKASGLQFVCAARGIDPADVLAVGDGHNDIEMLRWAGRGVAMGQAADAVRWAADDVTAHVDDDGLAAELARYLR